MARLNKEALIVRTIDAIVADGWNVVRLNHAGTHPARFTMEQAGVSHTVRLYVWNLSHGGKSRSADEFRIQITGIDGFAAEPNGRTLILGWGEEFGVFAGFDIQHRLGALGASPSIQINSATLQTAGKKGAEKQDKKKGEWAVAVRPDKIGRYVQHLTAAHAGGLEPLLADDGDPAADVLSSEIADLAETASGFDLDAPGEPELRAEIVAGVDEVLAALGEEPADVLAQIGHNHPPGPIEEPPALGEGIKTAAEQIRDELGTENVDPRKIGRAGAFLAWARKLLDGARQEGAKVLDKGKDMAREYMAKALWGTAGTLGVTFKEEIVEVLRHLAGSVLNWLQHISIF
jgi:hypothetical protein